MIHVKRLPQFDVLYNPEDGTFLFIIIGGRGGAKTYEVSKFITFSATIKKKRCVITRDERSLIEESILNEVLLRFDTANENGALGQLYRKMNNGIKDKRTGQNMVFTKGFRASSKGKKANLKSISNVDIAVIEEGEDIRDEDQFNTFVDGIRNEGAIVIFILNTPDIHHFIIRRYFTAIPLVVDGVPKEGFFDIVPKKVPGVQIIRTDYKQNPHLPAVVVDRYKGYGDPKAANYNEEYSLSAIDGYATSGRRGQILKHVMPISRAEYMDLDIPEVYGQDWGTAKPAAMVGVKFAGNTCYARKLNYDPLSTFQIACMWAGMGITKRERIIADNAEPETISKLNNGYTFKEMEDQKELIKKYPQIMQGRGFNVHACVKGKGAVNSGISIMKGLKLFAVAEDVDLWDEINNYVWDEGIDGKPTNTPKPGWDHLIDAWRYVCEDRTRTRENLVRRTNR